MGEAKWGLASPVSPLASVVDERRVQTHKYDERKTKDGYKHFKAPSNIRTSTATETENRRALQKERNHQLEVGPTALAKAQAGSRRLPLPLLNALELCSSPRLALTALAIRQQPIIAASIRLQTRER